MGLVLKGIRFGWVDQGLRSRCWACHIGRHACLCHVHAVHALLTRSVEKEKTTLSSVIKEKLMRDLSCPLA